MCDYERFRHKSFCFGLSEDVLVHIFSHQLIHDLPIHVIHKRKTGLWIEEPIIRNYNQKLSVNRRGQSSETFSTLVFFSSGENSFYTLWPQMLAVQNIKISNQILELNNKLISLYLSLFIFVVLWGIKKIESNQETNKIQPSDTLHWLLVRLKRSRVKQTDIE